MNAFHKYLPISSRSSVIANKNIIVSKIRIYADFAFYSFFINLENPRNCRDLYQSGSITDGVFWVYPDKQEPIQVLCDMTTDGDGWTTFQRRMDGSVDFFLDWASYKNGFGNLKGEFRLGMIIFTF